MEKLSFSESQLLNKVLSLFDGKLRKFIAMASDTGEDEYDKTHKIFPYYLANYISPEIKNEIEFLVKNKNKIFIECISSQENPFSPFKAKVHYDNHKEIIYFLCFYFDYNNVLRTNMHIYGNRKNILQGEKSFKEKFVKIPEIYYKVIPEEIKTVLKIPVEGE